MSALHSSEVFVSVCIRFQQGGIWEMPFFMNSPTWKLDGRESNPGLARTSKKNALLLARLAVSGIVTWRCVVYKVFGDGSTSAVCTRPVLTPPRLRPVYRTSV